MTDDPTGQEATLEIIPFPQTSGLQVIPLGVVAGEVAGPVGNDDSLKFAVSNKGPAAVDIFASETGISLYVFQPGESGDVDTVGTISARIFNI